MTEIFAITKLKSLVTITQETARSRYHEQIDDMRTASALANNSDQSC
jgi:hypothetical protein